jgi:aldose 1-epimerase
MKKRLFGRHGDRAVDEVVLESADAAVSILSYGCTVRDWRVDGARGSVPVVLGFPRLEDYVRHARAHGAICGRIANRTANARFELDGRGYELTRNEGPHQLHGGITGLQRRVWEMETDTGSGSVQLAYASPDGEEGYPGAVAFTVTFRLEGPRLVCEMAGLPDRPTPINLAQHSYYNLGGAGEVRDHVLWMDAPDYTPVGPDLIPDGSIRAVEGTRRDFTQPRSLAEADPDAKGYDTNFVLRPGRDASAPAARVSCPRTGLGLALWTAEPGLQIYDSAGASVAATGHDGARYGAFSGLCLEPQHFPDSLHNPDWPSIIRTPEAPYVQRLEVEIGRLE